MQVMDIMCVMHCIIDIWAKDNDNYTTTIVIKILITANSNIVSFKVMTTPLVNVTTRTIAVEVVNMTKLMTTLVKDSVIVRSLPSDSYSESSTVESQSESVS